MSHRVAVAAALAVATAASPAAAQFKDRLVQAPSLAAPERGSVKGPLANLAFTAAQLSRGGFTLPLPIKVPEDRGPLQAGVFPSYSPESGISEWGMGWQVQLQVERRRLLGELDYATDDFMSPWGRLRQGNDGYFYPVGLAANVRLERVDRTLAARAFDVLGNALAKMVTGGASAQLVNEQDWLATDFDGTRYRFSATAGVATERGTYAWSLVEVVNLAGDRTSLTWTANLSGRPFLTEVTWGERGGPAQYQLTLGYQTVAEPLVSRASGAKLSLDRRVRTITAATRDAVAGSFRERWHYTLGYRAAPFGPAFYLETVQRTFPSGENEPAMVYTYELDSTRLPLAQLQRYTGLDASFAALGQDAIQPDRSALLDVDADGRIDLEHADAQTLVKQTSSGWVRSALPPASGTHPSCRPFSAPGNQPRTLARLTSDVGEPNVLFTKVANTAPMTSQLLACDRLGHPLADLRAAGDWTLGANTRLVDVNRDRRPDLVHVSGEGVDVLRNDSDSQGIRFTPMPRFTWDQDLQPEVSWLNDFDGDGVVDIVTHSQDGFYVFYGRGQLRWTDPVFFPVMTRYGEDFGSVDDYEITFIDANKDGLADVLMTMGVEAFLFTNRGASFVEVPVSGFASVQHDFGVPVVADLTGRGNTEVAFASLGTTYFVELANASTGLMASAADGMGTVAKFAYARSAPMPGFDQRVTVLDKLTLESSGYDPVSYTYSYGSPVAHSVNHQLTGFTFAQRVAPYLTEKVEFTNDDDFAGLVTRTTAIDGRSSLVRFSEVTRQEAALAGVRFLRETSATSGTRRSDGSGAISTTTTHEAFANGHCPTRDRIETPSGTLVTESTLAVVPALGTLPHCTTGTVTMTGSHSDPSLNFTYSAAIDRNDIGQPTKVRQTGTGELVLQEVTYDALRRPSLVQQPGLGGVILRYDATTGLLREVVAPDGVATTTRARNPVTDGLQELGIDRGAAPWVTWFEFDGQERLWKSWDDLGVASASTPGIELGYAFASASAPGRIHAKQMLAPGSYSESVDLSSGNGESLATLMSMPGGWQVGGLTTVDVQQLESRSYWRAPMTGAPPSAITWSTLRSGATPLAFSRSSGSGLTTQADTVLGTGVTRSVVTSEALVGDTVVTTSVENADWTRQTATDATGKVRWTKDEAGGVTQLSYDALGRLVGVLLPDASQQMLRYDSFGRVAEVGRPGLAKVQYDYAPITGLPLRQRVLDGDGALERSVEWTRDGIGRVTQELHSQPRRNATRTITFDYDGHIDGATVPGQRGQLSQVASADFSRSARFSRDGTAESSSLKIGGWRELEQSWTRYEDGSVKDETWIVRDGQGHELSRLVQTNVRDAWGRVSEVLVDGQPFATMYYDIENRPDSVTFSEGGGEVAYHYDATTHAKNGYWMDARTWNSSVDWQYDNRGHVASELIALGGEVWERIHDYDGRGFLTRTEDAASEALYTYGTTGLPTHMNDLTGDRIITRSGRTIGIEGTESRSYQLDASGRVTGHDGLTLTWGPTGEIDEASRGARTWSYLYDETGQRIGKRENGVMVAGYIGPIYLDAQRAVLPVKINGQLVGTWKLTSTGNHFEQVATDPRGSLLGEGGVANLPTPYGVRAQRPAQSAALDYVERGYDADLGTVRFGARDYDPELGQFWSPDPLFLVDIEKCAGSPFECNLYGYAKGNPVTWTDPSGLDVWDWVADGVEAVGTVVGGAIGAAAGLGIGSGPGAVLGAALGRAAMSPIADKIRGEEPSLKRQLNAGFDGATGELGGQLLGAGIKVVGSAVRASRAAVSRESEGLFSGIRSRTRAASAAANRPVATVRGHGSVGAMRARTAAEIIEHETVAAKGELRRHTGDWGDALGLFNRMRNPNAPVTSPRPGVQIAPAQGGGTLTLRPGGTAAAKGGGGFDVPRLEARGIPGTPDAKIIFEGTAP